MFFDDNVENIDKENMPIAHPLVDILIFVHTNAL